MPLLGAGLYAIFTFSWTPLHYIHLMLITLIFCVASALAINRFVFGRAAALWNASGTVDSGGPATGARFEA